MFFTVEKFQRRVEELRSRRYTGLRSIAPMICMDDTAGPDEVHAAIPEKIVGRELHIGDMFIGRDRYLWAQKEVALPEQREGCEVVALFNFGMTGDGGNSGFEALLYVDGHPYQAVDGNHNDVILSEFAGKTVTMTLLLWSGLEGGGPKTDQVHRVQRMDVGYLHKPANKFYFLSKAITQTLVLLPAESTDRVHLTAALEGALKEIDWDADRFYSTVPGAFTALDNALLKLGKHTDITVHTVGHTHIDVAWLWRLKHTREKAMRSFSTVNRLMEEYDDYVFLQTQPQLYQYIKKDCPELYEKIRERVRSGKWETDGGMWLEADCNLTSGESLVRQFLHGITFFREEFGAQCSYLWLPDVFGYSWALPQIMRQCGLKTFMTTKISWNQYNSMPNDLFLWRGLDGSEILAYFIDTPGDNQPFTDRFSTYNGTVTAHSVLGSWNKFCNKNLSEDVLISYGYGDGGGGPNREMLEMRRALDRLPGVPNVRNSKAAEVFDILHANIENTRDYVPVWDGELYFEYHRGTYTSQAHNKRMNRLLEFKLARTEWLSCCAMLAGGSYDAPALHEGWETVLRNQFHDIIPGSSIREVYEDSSREYAQVDSSLDAVGARALASVCKPQEDAFTVLDFSSFGGRALAMLPEERAGVFRDARGARLPAQKCGAGWHVAVPNTPLSIQGVYFTPDGNDGADKASPFRIDLDARTVSTPFYDVSFDDEGALTRVYDRENAREALRGRGNVLEIYEDRPMNYDAWDLDIYYQQKKETIPADGACAIVEDGPLLVTLRFCYHYRRSTIRQDVTFYALSRRIDFVTEVDWQEDHRLLKTSFETSVRSTKATYDIQFGHVERPTHWNTSWDWARFEVCGHKWADLSEQGFGVALLNDCKYGYSVHNQTMTLSLLKSAKSPDTEADMGRHVFTYAFLPHAGGAADGGVIEEANALNLPLQVVKGMVPARTDRLIYVEDDGAAVDCVKKAEKEDCVVVRIHECRGGTRPVTLRSDYPLRRWAECNILEEETSAVNESDEIRCTVGPFELRTFKLWF